MKIDLHIHSTASDGTLSPFDILALAEKLNLGAIAITDHDTVDGSKKALQSGIPPRMGFLTGVEISAAFPPFQPGTGSFHILGYGVQLDDPALNQSLRTLRQARENRNPAILQRLATLGIPITLEEACKEAGEGQLGRPHIANLLVKKGVVDSIDQAFHDLLGPGKPAYVDKYRIECAQAIEIIRGAGGIPVLAHPGLLDINTAHRFEPLVVNLKSMGIQGIEVYYSQHSPDQIRYYAEVANRHELLITGGTDFHGSIQPEIQMGSGKGDLFVPYELYEKLVQR